MTHRPHPITGTWDGHDINDPPDAILFDHCERCTQHAQTITQLDDDKIRTLGYRQAYTATETKAQHTMRMAQAIVKAINRAEWKKD